METVLISGGTGLIGTAITKALLSKNYRVIILTRRVPEISGQSSVPNLSYAGWDIVKGSIDQRAIEESDYVIHLAGANVGEKRWTPARKRLIVDSRTKTGELIVDALSRVNNKVKAVISSSAIGWYGPDSSSHPHAFSEDDPPDNGFLGMTCQQWEQSISPVSSTDRRLVIFRTGIVLSRQGGVLAELLRPLRFRLATILGKGNQVYSWIHIDDLVALFVEAIKDRSYAGVFNAVAPETVTNKLLVTQIARELYGRNYLALRVPAPFLRLGLGEMSVEVLKSTTVSCDKLLSRGFRFSYPGIVPAIKNLLSR